MLKVFRERKHPNCINFDCKDTNFFVTAKFFVYLCAQNKLYGQHDTMS